MDLKKALKKQDHHLIWTIPESQEQATIIFHSVLWQVHHATDLGAPMAAVSWSMLGWTFGPLSRFEDFMSFFGMFWVFPTSH